MRNWIAAARSRTGSSAVEATANPRHGPLNRAWALLPLAFYLIHGFGYHIFGDNPWNAFWICHLSNVLLSIGLFLRSPYATAIALFWLLLGNVMWVIHLVTGGAFTPTSLFTHIGGLAVAVFGLLRLGFPPGAWYRAVLLMLVVQLLCRWFTPPEMNLNLAHRVYDGWEGTFPSYFWYMAMIYAIVIASYSVVEWVARRWFVEQRVE